MSVRGTGSEGFTVLEALIALVIVGLIAAALAETAHSLSLAARRGELRTNAVLIARALLEQNAASPALSAPNEVHGESRPYTWQVETLPYEPRNPAAAMAKITARVAWMSDGANGSVELSTLRLAK